MTDFKKLPSVFSFKRCHVISDALFTNVEESGATPLLVSRHGIRGTQNVASGGKDRNVNNIQVTDTAKTSQDATAVEVAFNLSFLDLKHSLDACASSVEGAGREMRVAINEFLDRAIDSEGLQEISRRYARNIANGRWLWRNRTIAESIVVSVVIGEQTLQFEALSIPTHHFDSYTDNEVTLGREIAAQLQGESLKNLQITARILFRGEAKNIEVFPSQVYSATQKEDGFARALYCLPSKASFENDSILCMGQAALRDQKVSNAIRTIDTWYPSFAEELAVLPIEANGASLLLQTFVRNNKSSAFDLLKKIKSLDTSSVEGMFILAIIERGGVFGESDKKAAKEKEETAVEGA